MFDLVELFGKSGISTFSAREYASKLSERRSLEKRTVILTSYMRPEMTRKSIEHVSTWSGLRKLVVVIDGLRPNANSQETAWRKETIRVVESFSHLSNLELWVYSQNVGITEHTIRLQTRSLELAKFPILLEEDIELNLDEFNHVDTTNKTGFGVPVLRSGYSHYNHPSYNGNVFKGNLFLPLWGLTYNAELVLLVEKTWKDKKFNPSLVENRIRSVFRGRSVSTILFRKKVERFWIEYMSWAFSNRNRWDALANYSLWTQNSFSSSTINRLANDISYIDNRGMNQRTQPRTALSHNLQGVVVDDTLLCESCEVLGSRILRSAYARVANSINHRISKIRT